MYRAIRCEGTHLHWERLAGDAVLRAQGIDVGEVELDLRGTVRVRQGAQANVHAAVAFTLQLHRDVIARVRHQTLHLATQNRKGVQVQCCVTSTHKMTGVQCCVTSTHKMTGV